MDMLDELTEETARVQQLALDADLGAAIAACPGWTAYDLVAHLGAIHRWAARATRTPPDGLVPDLEEPHGLTGSALAGWYATSAAELAEALSVDADRPCWTLAAPGTVRFWRRRQLHETVVHRWDLETALGRSARIHAAVALDGIDEVLTAMLPRQVRLRRVEESSRWVRLRVDGQDRALASSAAHDPQPVATVGGDASSILLLLWARLGLDALSVDGDRHALEEFLAGALTP